MNGIATSHVEEAANLAVERVFYIFGVDVKNAKDVEAFREDLRFNRSLRRLANHGLLAVIGLIAVGVVTAFFSALGIPFRGK